MEVSVWMEIRSMPPGGNIKICGNNKDQANSFSEEIWDVRKKIL